MTLHSAMSAPSPEPRRRSVSRRAFLTKVATTVSLLAGGACLERLAAQYPPRRRSLLRIPAPTMWSGGVTASGAVVKAWVPADPEAQLIVAEADNPENELVFGQTATPADAFGLRTFNLSGLSSNTAYTYRVESEVADEVPPTGQFQTFPAGPASFSFAFASCARTGSESPVFSMIEQRAPRFFLHLGDLHYENIARNNPEQFRKAWRRVLASSTQSSLYRNVPFSYVWDDHDYGPNGSHGGSPSRFAAGQVYREFMPHYPLAAPSSDPGVYHAFTCGRVHFIVTDGRSQRMREKEADGPSKTMLGPAQKAWLKQQFLAAKGASAPLIVWASSVPWIGHPGRGDGWAAFATERREIADFLKANGIGNVCIVSGDAHMLAADGGSNSDYATGGGAPLRVLHGSALDQRGSFKGGPYDRGWYLPRKREGCFGWVDITDTGGEVTVSFTGRNHLDEVKVSLDFSV